MQQRFLNILMKVNAFMRGRNGPDTLSLFLLAAVLLVNAANSFVRGLEVSVALYILAAALFGLAVFRTLSKNIDKRREENRGFLVHTRRLRDGRVFRALRERLKNLALRLRFIRTHRFRRCPHCGELLRLKKKRGRRRISCPKCGGSVKIHIVF